jgi:hypothetical protein
MVMRQLTGAGVVTELIIEQWTNLNQSIDYRWSVWVDGRRVQMGGPHKTADESEREGQAYCRKGLAQAPDRVTRL